MREERQIRFALHNHILFFPPYLSVSLSGVDCVSAEQKDILRWLFTPQSSELSDEPTLRAIMPGESLVEIGPRYINIV